MDKEESREEFKRRVLDGIVIRRDMSEKKQKIWYRILCAIGKLINARRKKDGTDLV